MSESLRDQLLKAGLVSGAQSRKAAHEQRVDHKKAGRDAVEAERAARRQETEAQQRARREADRSRETARRSAGVDRETEQRVRQIVASGRLERSRGPRRFYFLTRDDRVPYLELGDEVGARLERGGAAIVESPTGEVSVIDGEAARRVAELDATWLRCWNGRAEASAP